MVCACATSCRPEVLPGDGTGRWEGAASNARNPSGRTADTRGNRAGRFTAASIAGKIGPILSACTGQDSVVPAIWRGPDETPRKRGEPQPVCGWGSWWW
ncbi:hypothetical protein Sm713_65370 [Streptomyces sp. TS71-3]|nr:hypothetical protein Sm713_65370 [Streptomyces sp. TS71-3]